MNFFQFATRFTVVNKTLRKLADNAIPKIFPTYSPNPKGQNYALYCKYQLPRYKPWKEARANIWDNQEETDETFINAWKNFLETPYAQANVTDWLDKLQNVLQNQEVTEDQPAQEPEAARDDWMILCDIHTPFEDNAQIPDAQTNWHEDKDK